MKKFFALSLLLATISCIAQTPAGETLFRNVNVIPMTEEIILKNQDVLVRNGEIISIGNTGSVKFKKDARIVDATGKYLIPGLAEMHAHVPPVDDIEPMKEVLKLFLYNGVTTIRRMLGHPRHLELRSKIQSGEILGPHFYTSGPSFNGNSVKSPEGGAEMVRNQRQAGYDFLKLHPGLNKENFGAIAKTAKEVNIPFAGHVSFDVGVWRAIAAGYASIDHLDGFVESLVPGIDTIKEQDSGPFAMFIAKYADEKKIPALMQALKDKNIWVVPTQALAERWFSPHKDADAFGREPEMIYMKEETLKNWVTSKKNLMANPKYNADEMQNFIALRRKLIYECQKNGVGLLLGSDGPQVFNVPGFSVHHELKYMVDAGLTPYQALQSGTVNVAKYFNLKNSGVIKAGFVSDLVLLDANPLENIENTKKIAGIMLGKDWISKQEITAELKKFEKPKPF
ncbi:MAG TPA: amidohydrolase family protein [Chitinophagaceae bacterium]|nr:amidohydrolase family protein [Chitinophagaceae bacterium]